MIDFFKKKIISVKSPVEGEVINISEVPDTVFSEKMVGDGFAVKPSNGSVMAPVSGKVVQIFPTNHAFGIETKEGLEILVHIGIDTVDLEGEGFSRSVEVGAKVKVGDEIIRVDLDILKSKGKSCITPVVITSPNKVKSMELSYGNNDAAALITLNN